MLSSFALNCQGAMIVTNPSSQLPEMSTSSKSVSLSFLVRFCLFVTLIKCLKGHMSLGLLCEGVLWMYLSLSFIVFFGQVMPHHYCEQLAQRSQVSWQKMACYMFQNQKWLCKWVSEWVTKSPIELSADSIWTAKKKIILGMSLTSTSMSE